MDRIINQEFLEVNMKKVILKIIPIILLIMGCAGGATSTVSPVENSTANSGAITLDQALKEAATLIDERLAAGSKIAPLNFNSSQDKFSGYVLDELTANLVDSRKLTVVDRKEVELIRSEFDFQFSGEVGDDSIQELGRMLGAQSIISGSLTDLGGFHRIVIRVLNVQNASVEVQYRANIINDAIVAALLTGGKSSGSASSPPVSVVQGQTLNPVQMPVQPVSTDTTYKLIETVPPYHSDTSLYAGNNGGGVFYYPKYPYPNQDSRSARMGGNEYDNYIIFTSRAGSTNIINTVYFNFSGRYTLLTGIIGRLDTAGPVTNGIVKFYADDKLIETISVNGASLPKRFSLNITGVNQLVIQHNAANNITALADLRLSPINH
jgi:TolB-like protein